MRFLAILAALLAFGVNAQAQDRPDPIEALRDAIEQFCEADTGFLEAQIEALESSNAFLQGEAARLRDERNSEAQKVLEALTDLEATREALARCEGIPEVGIDWSQNFGIWSNQSTEPFESMVGFPAQYCHHHISYGQGGISQARKHLDFDPGCRHTMAIWDFYEPNSSTLPDFDKVLAGAYDAHLTEVGQAIAAIPDGNTVDLRIWHEYDLRSSTKGFCRPDPKKFIAAFRYVAKHLKAIAGDKLRVVASLDGPAKNGAELNGRWIMEECWPGDVVELVHVGGYHRNASSSQAAIDSVLSGFERIWNFVRDKNVNIGVPEMAATRQFGDDPNYIRSLLEWFNANVPADRMAGMVWYEYQGSDPKALPLDQAPKTQQVIRQFTE